MLDYYRRYFPLRPRIHSYTFLPTASSLSERFPPVSQDSRSLSQFTYPFFPPSVDPHKVRFPCHSFPGPHPLSCILPLFLFFSGHTDPTEVHFHVDVPRPIYSYPTTRSLSTLVAFSNLVTSPYRVDRKFPLWDRRRSYNLMFPTKPSLT